MKLSKNEFAIIVGNTIRESRLKKGLSIETLANIIGIEYTQLSRIELGKINTSIYQIYLICHALSIPIHEVFISIRIKTETGSQKAILFPRSIRKSK